MGLCVDTLFLVFNDIFVGQNAVYLLLKLGLSCDSRINYDFNFVSIFVQ